MTSMEVHYEKHGFDFEPAAGSSFTGRLKLDERSRELLARLVAAENEEWCLDQDGERLPAEQLFALSPWSYSGPHGLIKLLCRSLDLRDGSIRFNTPQQYAGEAFRWLRPHKEQDIGLDTDIDSSDSP